MGMRMRVATRLGTLLVVCTLALGALALSSAGAQTASETPPNPFGEYTPLTPTRILDTRTTTGGHLGKLGAGQSMTQQITGVGGVPATGVLGVVMNATVTEPTEASHLDVWPSGDPRPVVSNVNYVPGETVPNLVTVALGAGGAVQLYNNAGSVHVILDVVGYYADPSGTPGSRFHGINPSRSVRHPHRQRRCAEASLTSGQILKYKVTGQGRSSGHRRDQRRDERHRDRAELVGLRHRVPRRRGDAHRVEPELRARAHRAQPRRGEGAGERDRRLLPLREFRWSHAPARRRRRLLRHGPLDPGRRFAPVSPVRLFDTRIAGGCMGPNSISIWLFENTNIGSAILNVTVTQPTASGFMTVFAPPDLRPVASNLNYVPGQTVRTR